MRPGQSQQQLEGLERLQAAEHSGHGTEHAGFGAIADEAVARGLGPHAAQAGGGVVAAHQLQLAFVLVHAREQHRLAGPQREVVEQELGGEVVAAVEDEIVARAQAFGVVGVESQRVRFHAHVGIERSHTSRGERGFFLAALGQRIPGLAMQVGRFEAVGIDDAEAADTGTGEVLQHGNAEATRAHHQYGRGTEARLALGPDFTQRDLARVVRCGAVRRAWW